jgi:DNA-directed RNA polymerase
MEVQSVTWQPGDAAEAHPLWREQIELEISMAMRGADKYRARVRKAQEKEDMSRLRPYRRVTEAFFVDTANCLKGWLNACAKSRRAKEHAWHVLSKMDPNLSAYIAVRAALDHLAFSNRPGIISLAQWIGMELEYQARMEAWLATDEGKALYADIQRGLTKQRATATHRKRVNINRFNTLVRHKVKWRDWTRDDKVAAGHKLIAILCEATHHFTVEDDPVFRRGYKHKHILKPSEELQTYLATTLDDDAARHCLWLPTLIPPKPWTNMRDGGYYTASIPKPPLIKFRAHSEEMQGAAYEEFNALEMPRVYAALECVQNVPWAINREVLAVAEECQARGIAVRSLAREEPDVTPPQPHGMVRLKERKELSTKERRKLENEWIKDNAEEWRAWKRAAAKVYGDNARRVAHAMSANTTLTLAREFKERPEIYFPHALDFRGRMYPIPAYLQPQGNDLARGLLTFARGRPLGEEGGWWLAVNLANAWGHDKVSFEDRVAWVQERIPLINSIAASPMRNLEWTQSKTPWQLLAAILEFAKALEVGDAFVSCLPIRVDGTCNGIQHLATLMRDRESGAAVNLTRSNQPRDIYAEVAASLQQTLEGIEPTGGKAGHLAALWLDAFNREPIPRDFTKRQVMVLPYGATKEAYFKYIHAWLNDKEREEGRPRIPDDERKEALPFMVEHLWDAVSSRLTSARTCMEWLKECARHLAKVDEPIVWTTPSGFLVRHFYGKLKTVTVRTLINGEQFRHIDYQRSRKLSPKQQLQGISPNFVHSIDASANMETAIRFTMEANGAPYTTIHDSFGTVAGAMWHLHDTLRYSFAWVHQHDILADFRNRCVALLKADLWENPASTLASEEDAWQKADDTIPPVPALGDLNPQDVLDAPYFFA